MAYLPAGVNLKDRRVVIIGGGVVATQKVKTLLKYDAEITLFALEVCDEIKAESVTFHENVAYSASLLEGADIVYGATDKRELNRQIGEDGRKAGALVNVVDDPLNCDFVSPAIHQTEEVSIAVTSNAKNVYSSIVMRNHIRDLLEKFPPPPFKSKEEARKDFIDQSLYKNE